MRSKLQAPLLILMLIATLGLMAQSVSFEIVPKVLNPGDKGVISAELKIPADRKQSVDPNDPVYFYIEASHPDLTIGKMVLPKPTKVVSDTEWQYYPSVKLNLPFTVKTSAKAGKSTIDVLMSYNLCYESGMCDPPEEANAKLNFEILASRPISETMIAEPDSPVESEPESNADAEAELLEQSQEPAAEELPAEESSGRSLGEILKYFLFAFLGGLILNITPCVLPILPIRIMSIINQAQKDRSKVFRHVMVYTLGVLISFAILAAIFIAIQAAGNTAGWGTQNQNPYFSVALLSIVFVFALSLLGVFEITAPGMNTATKATTRGGYSGSFFGGIFAFLMAISCTGPFLGAALPFAMQLSPALIMVFFLLVGLGFAFPFILIGLFPKALRIIPKPGDWMVLFKELMGFVLLYLVYTMLKTTLALTGGLYLVNVIWFLLILGFAVWLYGRFVRFEYSKLTQWIFTIIPLIMIVFAAWQYLPITENHQDQETLQPVGDAMLKSPHAPEGWYVFSPQLHAKLLEEGKSVFLDIGAEWCKNCKTNEKTVLFTDDMMQAFADKQVVLLKGDFTRKDPVLLKWITDHERLGVPFNALYIPGEEALVFPELISKNMIREALQKVPVQGE
ncbi:MAG: cytochrome c biogenesis protein CcdA [Candidatus Cloacimonetes bacterium]|nr:cytochrome c biogenesis protein CcdA [Candidatus Cloacimonadota bacterium]